MLDHRRKPTSKDLCFAGRVARGKRNAFVGGMLARTVIGPHNVDDAACPALVAARTRFDDRRREAACI